MKDSKSPPPPRLKRCPFCKGKGSVRIWEHNINDAKVVCTKCHAEGPLFDKDDLSGPCEEHSQANIQAAIFHWNTRAS